MTKTLDPLYAQVERAVDLAKEVGRLRSINAELLEALEDAIEELREYELAASGEHYNNPRFNAIIAKAKEG